MKKFLRNWGWIIYGGAIGSGAGLIGFEVFTWQWWFFIIGGNIICTEVLAELTRDKTLTEGSK